MMTSILFSVVRETRDFLAPLLSRFCQIVISQTEYENDAGQSASRGENPWCAHESIYSRLPSGLWLISDNQQQLLDLGVQYAPHILTSALQTILPQNTTG